MLGVLSGNCVEQLHVFSRSTARRFKMGKFARERLQIFEATVSLHQKMLFDPTKAGL